MTRQGRNKRDQYVQPEAPLQGAGYGASSTELPQTRPYSPVAAGPAPSMGQAAVSGMRAPDGSAVTGYAAQEQPGVQGYSRPIGTQASGSYAYAAAHTPHAQQRAYAVGGTPQVTSGVVPGGVAGAAGMPGAQAGAYAGAPVYVPPRTSVPPEEPKRKKRRAAFWIALVIAILAIVAAVVLAFMLLNPAKSSRSGDLGQLEGKTAAEVQAELDRVVEEGMFNISIASTVELATGTSEGELRIENVPNNNYLMRVEIARDDTGEKIYETDVIEPNHHIQSDVLDADLDPGSYECTATFFALDPETEDEIGQVAAAMRINVLG